MSEKALQNRIRRVYCWLAGVHEYKNGSCVICKKPAKNAQ